MPLLADLLMANPWHTDGLKSAQDIAKQVITLSGGAVAFTVTFVDKFVQHGKDKLPELPLSLYVAWGLFGLAILLALWTLMAITGTLGAFDRQANGWKLTESQDAVTKGAGGNVQKPALAMLGAFLFAIFAMIWTGFRFI